MGSRCAWEPAHRGGAGVRGLPPLSDPEPRHHHQQEDREDGPVLAISRKLFPGLSEHQHLGSLPTLLGYREVDGYTLGRGCVEGVLSPRPCTPVSRHGSQCPVLCPPGPTDPPSLQCSPCPGVWACQGGGGSPAPQNEAQPYIKRRTFPVFSPPCPCHSLEGFIRAEMGVSVSVFITSRWLFLQLRGELRAVPSENSLTIDRRRSPSSARRS